MAISTTLSFFTLSPASQGVEVRARTAKCSKFSSVKVVSQLEGDGSGRRIWRRRKLTTKKDPMSRRAFERTPFLEEHVRKLREGGKGIIADINRLLLTEPNRYDFVNEVAAQATEYVRNNKDEYGFEKKAILQVISDRMNERGIERPDAYYEPDHFKPGPGMVKDFYT